ncbi:MAG: hypothetical protein WAW52_05185 [Methanothrix sp.]
MDNSSSITAILASGSRSWPAACGPSLGRAVVWADGIAWRGPGGRSGQKRLESSEGGFSRGPGFGNDEELRLISADNYNRATTGTTKAQSAQRTHKDAKIISVTDPLSAIAAGLFARRARTRALGGAGGRSGLRARWN